MVCVCVGGGETICSQLRGFAGLPVGRRKAPARYTTGIVYPWVSDVCFGASPASHTRQQNTPRKHRAPAGGSSAAQRFVQRTRLQLRPAALPAQCEAPAAPVPQRPGRPWPAGSPRCQESASPAASLPHRIVYPKTRASRKQKRRQITLSANNPVGKNQEQGGKGTGAPFPSPRSPKGDAPPARFGPSASPRARGAGSWGFMALRNPGSR